jgi:DNA-binding LytR/AlgR family response regulator
MEELKVDINVATNISKEFKNIEITIKAPEMTEEVKNIANNIMKMTNSAKQIIGTKDNRIYLLTMDEIISFYSEDRNNYCKTKNGIFKIKEKLYELEENLAKGNYVRISNSCIVNLKYVDSFDTSIIGTIEVIFKDGTKEYVSRRKVKEVMKKIKEWGN